jgi:chemotaxis regulatin CheY-phosphate phosphatase CheZ
MMTDAREVTETLEQDWRKRLDLVEASGEYAAARAARQLKDSEPDMVAINAALKMLEEAWRGGFAVPIATDGQTSMASSILEEQQTLAG